MNPKHSNPTRPRRDKGNEAWARAPYNFVPLPQKLVLARELLSHAIYHQEALTGWIDCELETCSPTYVRGMMTPDKFSRLGDKKSGEKAAEEKYEDKQKEAELSVKEKEELAPFFSTQQAEIEGFPCPAIPGSSLRGMIRSLVEIVGYGRMRWVGQEPTFTFRAVAASKEDPLRTPYQEAVKGKVEAGYLKRDGDKWSVQPALTPAAMGWPGDRPYLTVREYNIDSSKIPGYRRLNSPKYRPQLHEVSFDVTFGSGKGGRNTTVSQIGSRAHKFAYKGTLVCSGNMLETAKSGQKSPRTSHTVILLPDLKARSVQVQPQAVKDYLAGLTPFQKEELTDWGGAEWGCLRDGAPVFYVTEGNEVVYFGHCPNFRIPARLFGQERAATPPDFVPDRLRIGPQPDLADAIFGWVEEKGTGPKGQTAGRVFFTDAQFVEASEEGVWYKSEPIAPHTLSGPKPTTFQHYLVQDRNLGHDPDQKSLLAHYGTSPDETQIRGHKLYWHKGRLPDIEASLEEREHESQLTRITLVKPGVQFRFRIHFENLREEELGALWWALTLPGKPETEYRHKLGMGKPLGMGTVKLTPTLYLADRPERYQRLFLENSWHEPARPADGIAYRAAFERFVLESLGVASQADTLAKLGRIQALLALLQWHEDSVEWREVTRYMGIQHGPKEVNEYKERPVLPNPIYVEENTLLLAGQAVKPPTRQRDITAGRDTSAQEIKRGQVKWFRDDKGYGLITQEDGTDIFVHFTGISGTGRRSLKEGQRVIFKIGKGMKGPQAVDVEVDK